MRTAIKNINLVYVALRVEVSRCHNGRYHTNIHGILGGPLYIHMGVVGHEHSAPQIMCYRPLVWSEGVARDFVVVVVHFASIVFCWHWYLALVFA